MKIRPFMLPPQQDRAAYDHLFNLIQEAGSAGFCANYAAELRQWRKERDPRWRRLKWCLSTIHEDEELQALVLERLASYGLDQEPPTPIEAQGASVAEHDADLSDTILFSDLGISYGERIGVGHFDSREEAQALADRYDRSTVYSDGDGGYYTVYDPDPSD